MGLFVTTNTARTSNSPNLFLGALPEPGGAMRRREFIKLLGGTAAGLPFAAHAQQPRIRRIGALMNIRENDPQSIAWALAFERGLKEWGWTLGDNLQIEY